MQYLLSLLPSLLLTLLACWVGVLLTKLIFVSESWKARLCFGVVIGLVGLSWIGFLWALIGGLNGMTIGATAAIFAVALLLLRPGSFSLHRSDISIATLTYYGCWGVFFCWLFSRVITLEADGLYTAPANNYGDLAFHFSVVTSFADGANFPPHNPIFHGLNFTYPFLMDFLAAFFHQTGADWAASFFIPNVILSLALVGLIELLTERLTTNILAARLAPVLFFLSGGLGFIYFIRDWQQTAAGGLSFLTQLPQSYTKNDELHLQWGNMLTTLLVPQRSLLLGVPVFAMIVLLWWKALHRQSSELESQTPATDSPLLSFSSRRFYLFVAGIFAGLMPLLHAHGFFALMLVSAAMALLFFSWDWLAFFIPAGVLALPQALWLSATGTKSSLFNLHFGWAVGNASFLKFFALNFGLFFVLLVITFFSKELRTRRFYAPFLLCFLVPHVVTLAPWIWDNIKVLLYWYLVSCPLVALFLAQLLRRRMIVWPVLGGVLLVALTLSGALDVLRGLSPIENLRLFDVEQMKVAELIKQRIPPRALMLSAPIHNSVLALTGRQMLMGYPGHLWSHGIKFDDRERDLKMMFQGGAEAQRLLQQYGIDYVIIGPVETSELNADEGFFAATYQAVIDEAGYRVYHIPRS
jgi:hypothetical protein